jgi:nucleoid-associated protein YgaU
MRLLLISTLIAVGLTIGGVSSFAADDTKTKGQTEEMKGSSQDTQISGQITDIKGDSLMVKDSTTGKIQKVVPAEPSELSKVKVGDNVTVTMRDGKAVAINKTEGTKEGMKENTGTSGNTEEKTGEMKGNTETTPEQAAPNPKSEEGSQPMRRPEEGTTGKIEGGMEGNQYTVKPGDTLSRIARRTLGSSAKWKEIAELNNLNEPYTLHVGQRLTLPSTAQGSSGTMQEGTEMKGMKGNTETTPEQTAPNPNSEEGSQPKSPDESQEKGTETK